MSAIENWIGISGSWRKINSEIEQSVRKTVRDTIDAGGGIVTGGALNVDYFATDEALHKDPKAEHVRVFLPTTLDTYAAHYRKRAIEGVITSSQAEDLIEQLNRLKKANPNALVEEPKNSVVDQTTYYERNMRVIESSDALVIFQVNDSPGTQDAIDKAKQKGIPITVNSYIID